MSSSEQEARATGAGRPLRAHAQRNRDNLIEIARIAFAAGRDSEPLENIARDAGVGIGTLYRHFPTREALFEAVYAAELEAVTSNVDDLLERHRPDAALRAWMGRYAEFIRTKRGIMRRSDTGRLPARVAALAGRERVRAAIESIVVEGMRQGVFRSDVIPDDVTALIIGAIVSPGTDGTTEQLERMVGLVVDALRPGAPPVGKAP